jgi:multiple sugar transport system permease protein
VELPSAKEPAGIRDGSAGLAEPRQAAIRASSGTTGQPGAWRGATRPSAWGRRLHSESLAGWGLAGPALLYTAALGIFPVFWGIVLSFQQDNLLGGTPRWVGWANYSTLAHDPIFRKALWHTALFTGLFVPLSIATGLAVAVAMNRKIRLLAFYRTAVYVTLAISTISTAIMFLWLTDPTYGVINDLLHALHLHTQQFLSQPETSLFGNQALYVIVAMDVWGWLGFNVVIYLAALQSIPQELLEAAEIDGASAWNRFRTVTLPLLGPATLFLVVWLTINAFQLFDEVYLTTHGGPLYSTTVIVYYLYDKTFQQFDAGLGAAAAWILFAVIAVISLIQWKIGRRTVYSSTR